MQAQSSLVALAVAAALAGCGASPETSATSSGHGGEASSTSSTGGSAPVDCPALAVTAPADVGMPGGVSARPALVFGTNNGRVVSLFHAWSQAPSPGTALQVTTLEPWEIWPPVAGDHFAIDPAGGQSFAVGDALHGNVALLLSGANGLGFANGVSATSPQSLLPSPLADTGVDPGDPAAIELVRGYDSPPGAVNVGYMEMLAMWDMVDPTSGAHALRLRVSSGDNALIGLIGQPDDPDLACAGDRIAAAAVRANSSWLVLTASGSELMGCADAASADLPSSLAVDRIDWGTPDVIEWTVERADEAVGKDPIEQIRMIPELEGALGLVQRGGHADLVRVDAQGLMHAAGTVAPVDGNRILLSELVGLSKGSLVVHVDEGAPGRIHLEVRDAGGALGASATLEASAPITSLSVLASKAGDAALLGWATSAGALQLARVGCKGGA